ncbi:hypothetical protein P261_00625 [Lachnospiraceae bacterium TWA4]|nr:hypothetical protein P261_00625 [Lachnospiraceae bacterium TWA4]
MSLVDVMHTNRGIDTFREELFGSDPESSKEEIKFFKELADSLGIDYN